MRKILVPCRMAQVATNAIIDLWDGKPSHWNPSTDKMTIATAAVEAALRWLSENPIVPTDEELFSVSGSLPVKMAQIVWSERDRELLAEWQRRMFLAPEPEVPEAIKDLLVVNDEPPHDVDGDEHDAHVLEAYRRGLEANRQGVKDRYDK